MRFVGTVVVLALFTLLAYAAWRVTRGVRRGSADRPGVRGDWSGRRMFRRGGAPGRGGPPVVTVCLQCRGTGWIDRRERTLEFTGDGFADVQNPSTMCQACGGTGERIR